MDEKQMQELRTRVEQETCMSIAKKMQEEGVGLELILKYTGVRPEEPKKQENPYDLVARQVAAEMLMRGMPVSSVQMATRLPREDILELKQQYAGFFSGNDDSEDNEGPSVW